jgi:hypothetical protein
VSVRERIHQTVRQNNGGWIAALLIIGCVVTVSSFLWAHVDATARDTTVALGELSSRVTNLEKVLSPLVTAEGQLRDPGSLAERTVGLESRMRSSELAGGTVEGRLCNVEATVKRIESKLDKLTDEPRRSN